MTKNDSQSWNKCDHDIQQFVDDLVDLLQKELQENLVGVYLHGSLAMGCYYRPKSDIDIIVVAKEALGPIVAKSALKRIALHSSTRPTTGDIELSVITSNTAKLIPNPTPYEIHYSTKWQEKALNGTIEYDSNKTDIDLPAHIMYVRQRGLTLDGQAIDEVFGEFDWNIFMEAVIDDFDWIIEGENILETPFYGVLNICRVLQLQDEGSHTVHSKEEGGKWGLKYLPFQFHSLIQKALDVYRSSDEVTEAKRRTGGLEWYKDELLAFRDFARSTKT